MTSVEGPDKAQRGPSAPGTDSYLRDPAFMGITVTQFFGAFNDNLFKQTVLLLFVAAPRPDGGSADWQWVGTLVFSLPFILFSGYAGYLSDRYGKAGVIVASKVAEIVIMAMGVVAFYWYGLQGLSTLVFLMITAILFAMGAQSAFFGPGKYGILPELFRERDLPGANGLILMTTFLAIIFGSALAGELKETFAAELYKVGAACVIIAIVGTLSALLIRRPPAAQPSLRPSKDSWFIPRQIRALLWQDHELRNAVIVSTVFWLSAAMVQMAINSLGKNQLMLDDSQTSIMVATISAGIAIGSILAGVFSKHRFNPRVLQVGAGGMVVCLLLLAAPGGEHNHLLGFRGSIAVLVVLGAFTGLFAVPLQVFLQSRPPAELKGRMIATQNLLNWIGITASAGLYLVVERSVTYLNLPKSSMFVVMASFMLAVLILYRPNHVHLFATREA